MSKRKNKQRRPQASKRGRWVKQREQYAEQTEQPMDRPIFSGRTNLRLIQGGAA